jgi:DNA repair protein RecN (Recombination protein N)
MLGQIVHSLDGLARLDPSRSITAEQARLILESIEDLIRNLRNYQETIEFNPKRLSQVEERLSLIHNLKRKYGNTIDEVLAFAKKARQELDNITHAGERIEELDKRISESLHKLSQQGRALSQKRHWAAQALCKAIVLELTDLNMEGAQFDVSFQTRPSPDGVLMENGERVAYDANGIERVEFLVAPNPGEGLKPLVKIASGGETSRLMLALKNVLTKADQVPTLVFDEIDQGIGGRVGMVVGQKLWNLARLHQVLCITHLPQLAVFGEQHFHVQKTVGDGRTYTQVQVLHGDERLVELAQMMGEVSKGTRQSAKELIEAVSELTK